MLTFPFTWLTHLIKSFPIQLHQDGAKSKVIPHPWTDFLCCLYVSWKILDRFSETREGLGFDLPLLQLGACQGDEIIQHRFPAADCPALVLVTCVNGYLNTLSMTVFDYWNRKASHYYRSSIELQLSFFLSGHILYIQAAFTF